MHQIIETHTNWPVYADVFKHPAPGLPSNAQFSQTRHLSTQLHSRERTGSRLLWSTTRLYTNVIRHYLRPTIGSLVLISLISHGLCWTVFGQVNTRRAIIHEWGLAKSPICDCGQQQRWIRVHWQSSTTDYNYFTKLKMAQSSGWSLQRLQHSRNKNEIANTTKSLSLDFDGSSPSHSVLYNLFSYVSPPVRSSNIWILFSYLTISANHMFFQNCYSIHRWHIEHTWTTSLWNSRVRIFRRSISRSVLAVSSRWVLSWLSRLSCIQQVIARL